jgi:hypothetical protein
MLTLRQESSRLREVSERLRQRSRFILRISQRLSRKVDDLTTVTCFQHDLAARLPSPAASYPKLRLVP